MEKIISLYQRNYEGDRLVRNEVVPGAQWVLAGEGVATRKFDGTPCRIVARGPDEVIIQKRYDAKHGKTPPEGFEPAQEPDPVTGHWPGWITCSRSKPEDRYFFEGMDNGWDGLGSYELCGPKINGNPEGYDKHVLIRHGQEHLLDVPRDFMGISKWLAGTDFEGIVWHHPDGRMVKIKVKDFGWKRRPLAEVRS